MIYEMLARWGYLHPIHPILAHVPIGLMIGALLFFLIGKRFQRGEFFTSAKHNIQLSLLFLILAILTGIFDWNRFYGGAWLTEVKMKLPLAIGLFLITAVIALSRKRINPTSSSLLTLYLLGTLNVGALGYYGGQMVYEGRAPNAPSRLESGRLAFYSRCSGCHANGGNIIMPDHPIRSSQELVSLDVFSRFVRKPTLPDGHPGPMPGFSEYKLSAQEIEALYQYICFSFREHLH